MIPLPIRVGINSVKKYVRKNADLIIIFIMIIYGGFHIVNTMGFNVDSEDERVKIVDVLPVKEVTYGKSSKEGVVFGTPKLSKIKIIKESDKSYRVVVEPKTEE